APPFSGAHGLDLFYGHGRINVARALSLDSEKAGSAREVVRYRGQTGRNGPRSTVAPDADPVAARPDGELCLPHPTACGHEAPHADHHAPLGGEPARCFGAQPPGGSPPTLRDLDAARQSRLNWPAAPLQLCTHILPHTPSHKLARRGRGGRWYPRGVDRN